MSAETQAAPKASAGYSYFVVWFLAIVYTLNFLDRQIVSILGKQISAELHLTKTEFGLLGGTSFALLYTTCSIGVAYLADRVSRKWIIALACAIWSRLHRALRHGAELHADPALPDGRGLRRSGRFAALLFADLRLFPGRAPRHGAGDLFAGRARGLDAGCVPGRQAGPGLRLAHGLLRGRRAEASSWRS